MRTAIAAAALFLAACHHAGSAPEAPDGGGGGGAAPYSSGYGGSSGHGGAGGGATVSSSGAAGEGGAPSKNYELTDDTAKDPATGLTWQRQDPAQTFASVGDVDSYCASLSLGGLTGWRTPKLDELKSLLLPQKDCPLLDHAAFPGAYCDWYISGDINGGDPYNPQMLDFLTGSVAAHQDVGPFDNYEARCVRGP